MELVFFIEKVVIDEFWIIVTEYYTQFFLVFLIFT